MPNITEELIHLCGAGLAVPVHKAWKVQIHIRKKPFVMQYFSVHAEKLGVP